MKIKPSHSVASSMLILCLGSVLLMLLPVALCGFSREPISAQQDAATQRWNVTVKETAGIRRFGHPVSASVLVPHKFNVEELAHFRLLLDGKTIPAQIQWAGWPNATDKVLAIDFSSSHLPFERRDYVLEYDPKKQGAAPIKDGIRVEEKERTFQIVRPGLTFVVPKDLAGLLHSVKTPTLDFLHRQSPGLLCQVTKNGELWAVEAGKSAPVKAKVTKKGPLVVALQFEGVEIINGKQVPFVVEMEFPRSRSWVQIITSYHDRDKQIAALQVGLNLDLKGEPTLVDFGTSTLVYTKIRRNEFALLRAGSLTEDHDSSPTWKTFLGNSGGANGLKGGALTPLVFAPPGKSIPPGEGWAHIMDQQHCTAVAVAGGGAAGQQCDISVTGTGLLQVRKHFRTKGAPVAKTLTMWLHFVSMPVHVGAATSPQSMMSPLAVEVSR
jgi:hypothetical protein